MKEQLFSLFFWNNVMKLDVLQGKQKEVIGCNDSLQRVLVHYNVFQAEGIACCEMSGASLYKFPK